MTIRLRNIDPVSPDGMRPVAWCYFRAAAVAKHMSTVHGSHRHLWNSQCVYGQLLGCSTTWDGVYLVGRTLPELLNDDYPVA